MLRTAEGLGVREVYLTGYSPYPKQIGDGRLPHIANKLNDQIHKTALGAESLIKWTHADDVAEVITLLKKKGYVIVALEQTPSSQPLPTFQAAQKTALVVGREVDGIEPEVVALCDQSIEIPMFGKKESFNVVIAAAMALYHCRFMLL